MDVIQVLTGIDVNAMKGAQQQSAPMTEEEKKQAEADRLQ